LLSLSINTKVRKVPKIRELLERGA
jgi:hypothetical protein